MRMRSPTKISGKYAKKIFEKTERKVQASTGIVTKVVILQIQSSVDFFVK